jgi:hypothetical protein
MHYEGPGRGDLIGPLPAMGKVVPCEASTSSERLGRVGLEATRFRASPPL